MIARAVAQGRMDVIKEIDETLDEIMPLCFATEKQLHDPYYNDAPKVEGEENFEEAERIPLPNPRLSNPKRMRAKVTIEEMKCLLHHTTVLQHQEAYATQTRDKRENDGTNTTQKKEPDLESKTMDTNQPYGPETEEEALKSEHFKKQISLVFKCKTASCCHKPFKTWEQCLKHLKNQHPKQSAKEKEFEYFVEEIEVDEFVCNASGARCGKTYYGWHYWEKHFEKDHPKASRKFVMGKVIFFHSFFFSFWG